MVDRADEHDEPDHTGQLGHRTSGQRLGKQDRQSSRSARGPEMRAQIAGPVDGYSTARRQEQLGSSRRGKPIE